MSSNESRNNTATRLPIIEGVTYDELPFPSDVIVETCGYCNLKCSICPYPFLKRDKGEMPTEIFKRIVDEISMEGESTRLWLAIMGEPLLGRHFAEMLDYTVKKDIKHVHLNTNGMLLKGAVAEKIIQSQPEAVIVSIDAASSEVYNQIRVGGDLSTVKKNVCDFIRLNREAGANIKIIAQFIVMDENRDELESFKKYWLNQGAIVKVRLLLGWGKGVEVQDLGKAGIDRSFPCPWLFRTVSIHWNGDFAQCDADYEGIHNAGNISTTSIKEVWENELAERREKHKKRDFSHPLCVDCLDWCCGRSEFFYPN